MADIVRILRFLEYIGPRKAIEDSLARRGVKGEHHGWRLDDEVTIREGFIGEFPERWEQPQPTHYALFELIDKRDGESMLTTESQTEVFQFMLDHPLIEFETLVHWQLLEQSKDVD